MPADATVRAYEAVVAYVEERVLAGDLAVGDLLPAERELAVQLGVSRSAAREGVRTLQAQGVLQSSVGAGRAGGTRVTAMPSGALTRLLRMHVALANFPVGDVLEVRVALERLSVRLAAGRLGQEDQRAVREVLAQMRTASSRADFNDADSRFHIAIAEAAGNRLAADATVAIRESVRLPLMAGFSGLTEEDYAELTARLIEEHQAIFDALVEGDAARAEVLVEVHVRAAWDSLGQGRAAGVRQTTPPSAGTMPG